MNYEYMILGYLWLRWVAYELSWITWAIWVFMVIYGLGYHVCLQTALGRYIYTHGSAEIPQHSLVNLTHDKI